MIKHFLVLSVRVQCFLSTFRAPAPPENPYLIIIYNCLNLTVNRLLCYKGCNWVIIVEVKFTIIIRHNIFNKSSHSIMVNDHGISVATLTYLSVLDHIQAFYFRFVTHITVAGVIFNSIVICRLWYGHFVLKSANYRTVFCVIFHRLQAWYK